jgi:hypothetical protein
MDEALRRVAPDAVAIGSLGDSGPGNVTLH